MEMNLQTRFETEAQDNSETVYPEARFPPWKCPLPKILLKSEGVVFERF